MKVKLNKIKVPLLILGALLVLIALISVGVYAKYISTRGKPDGTVTSQNFYFESDYLKENGATYTVNPSTSGTDIPFELMNYADEYRASDFAVEYTVTVVASDGSTPSVTNKSAVLTKSGDTKQATVTINNAKPGVTYTVTAVGQTGEKGYTKTLSASFTVNPIKENAYMHVEDKGEYVTLTVWTENLTGNVTITLDNASELLPDNTDPRMLGWKSDNDTYTDEFTTEYSSYKYRFFKSDINKTYNNAFFEVKVGAKTAEPGTP